MGLVWYYMNTNPVMSRLGRTILVSPVATPRRRFVVGVIGRRADSCVWKRKQTSTSGHNLTRMLD
jgi:hypothetical protein